MNAEFEAAKKLAHAKRADLGIITETLNLNVVRAIYKAEHVSIDYRKLPPRIRASYMCDDNDPGVLVNSTLPREPRLFSLLHELKHHFTDRPLIEAGGLKCGDYNAHKDIEISAEIFAAEFIWPEQEFAEAVKTFQLMASPITPERIVQFKQTLKAPISYSFLRKRLEFFRLIPKDAYKKVHFQKLEEEIVGLPIYKQAWFRERRARRAVYSKAS